MKKYKVLILLLLTILTQTSLGQDKKTEKEFKSYLQRLKATNVDTFLTVNTGCTGCEIQYDDFPKLIDNGHFIYVLSKHKGKYNIVVFNEIHNEKSFNIDTCSLFDFVFKNKTLLNKKTKFYKGEMSNLKSKDTFYPPRPIQYSYEELTIQTPNFSYNFKVLDGCADFLGIIREKEIWFKLTTEIIKRVYGYLPKEPK